MTTVPAFAEASSIETILQSLAETAADPWEKAIYAAGARDIVLEDYKAAFSLRPFDPKLKSLPKYTDSPDVWREAFYANVSEYNLLVSLKLNNGEADAAAQKQLKKAVSGAAKSAKSAFEKKAVVEALAGTLFPKEAGVIEQVRTSVKEPGFTSEQLALFFSAQSGRSLNVKGGPHALVLSVKASDPEAFVREAYANALIALLSKNTGEVTPRHEIEEAFNAALSVLAQKYSKKAPDTIAFTFDVDSFMVGDYGADYRDYIERFHIADTLSALVREIKGPTEEEKAEARKAAEAVRAAEKEQARVMNQAGQEKLARLMNGEWTELDILYWKIVQIMDTLMEPYIDDYGNTYDIWELSAEMLLPEWESNRDNLEIVPTVVPVSEMKRRHDYVLAIVNTKYLATVNAAKTDRLIMLEEETLFGVSIIMNQSRWTWDGIMPWHLHQTLYNRSAPEEQEKVKMSIFYEIVKDFNYHRYREIGINVDASTCIGTAYRYLENSGEAAVYRNAPEPELWDEVRAGAWTQDQAALFKLGMALEILKQNYEIESEKRAPGLDGNGRDKWPLPYDETMSRFKDIAKVFAYEIKLCGNPVHLEDASGSESFDMDYARYLVSAYFTVSGKDPEEAGWSMEFIPTNTHDPEEFMTFAESRVYDYFYHTTSDLELRHSITLTCIVEDIVFFSRYVPPLERTDLPDSFRELAASLESQAGKEVVRKILADQGKYKQKLARLKSGEWTEIEIEHYKIVKLMDFLSDWFYSNDYNGDTSAIYIASEFTVYCEMKENPERIVTSYDIEFFNQLVNNFSNYSSLGEDEYKSRVEDALAILGEAYFAAVENLEKSPVEVCLSQELVGVGLSDNKFMDPSMPPPDGTDEYLAANPEEQYVMRMKYLSNIVNLIDLRYQYQYWRLEQAGTADMYRKLEPPRNTQADIEPTEIWPRWINENKDFWMTHIY